MQVTITSGGIQALCGVLAILAGAAVFIVDALISRHIRRLNGTYIYAAGSKLTGHEIEERLLRVEAKI